MIYMLRLLLLATVVVIVAGSCEHTDGKPRKYDIFLVSALLETNSPCFGKSSLEVEENDDGEMRMNGNMDVKDILPNGCQMQVSADKMEQNTWVSNLRQQPQAVQAYMDSNKNLLQQLFDASNMTAKFPLEKGNVIIQNFKADVCQFPTELKNANWRISAEITNALKEVLFKFVVVARIELKDQ